MRILVCLALVPLMALSLLLAQHRAASCVVVTGGMIGASAIDWKISVRNAHGNVIDAPAVVRLTSAATIWCH
jgi:hypothetical protein